MSEFDVFAHEYFFVYLWFIITTFVNVVAPLAISVVVNPVTAFFTDPQRAIGIGALVFAFSGLHRIYLFREHVLVKVRSRTLITAVLPYSIVGAMLGGLLIVYLDIQILAIAIIFISLYFIVMSLRQMLKKHSSYIPTTHTFKNTLVFLVSGFFQGAGLPGADIRNNYLRTMFQEVSVRAIGSIIGTINFFIAGSIIYFHSRLTTKDIIFIITVMPAIFIAQYYGKRYLEHLKDVHAKLIAISFSILGIVLLSIKYIFV